ncbi:hypothetical protein S40288_11428 [Stachybotrys chartarum IBT 40288]|nr:hypothetical protein S40288_11428 [Stachybotrys chartarum IBT 40288]
MHLLPPSTQVTWRPWLLRHMLLAPRISISLFVRHGMTIISGIPSPKLFGIMFLFMNYNQKIEQYGGPIILLNELENMILPEIKDSLQNGFVTRAILEGLFARQRALGDWNGASGYLDFITDSRSTDYFRLYVGQFSLGARRIVRQHVQSVLQGSIESLHYYILWLGNGTRTANFLQLWQFPQHTDTTDQCFSSTGLNIMTPIVQGFGKASKRLRDDAALATRFSPDPQIRHWHSFRSKRDALCHLEKHAPRPLFHVDYETALRAALGHQNQLARYIPILLSRTRQECHTPPHTEDYVGDLTAPIGFLLHFGVTSPAERPEIGGSDPSSKLSDIPDVLKGCGFNTSNCFVWTHDFGGFAPLNISNLKPGLEVALVNRHRQLLSASQAKIVFLCGSQAANIVRSAFPDLPKFIIELRALGISDTSKRQTECYFIEASTVYGKIFRQLRAEDKTKDGSCPRMTAQNVDTDILYWLSRKGISQPEDIQDIERLGGTLARGLLMVLHALRNISKGTDRICAQESPCQMKSKPPSQRIPHNRENFEILSSLVLARHQVKEKESERRLAEIITDDEAHATQRGDFADNQEISQCTGFSAKQVKAIKNPDHASSHIEFGAIFESKEAENVEFWFENTIRSRFRPNPRIPKKKEDIGSCEPDLLSEDLNLKDLQTTLHYLMEEGYENSVIDIIQKAFWEEEGLEWHDVPPVLRDLIENNPWLRFGGLPITGTSMLKEAYLCKVPPQEREDLDEVSSSFLAVSILRKSLLSKKRTGEKEASDDLLVIETEVLDLLEACKSLKERGIDLRDVLSYPENYFRALRDAEPTPDSHVA